MHEERPFTWISFIPALAKAPSHVVMAIGVSVLLILLTWVASTQLKAAMKGPGGALVPDGHWSFRNFFEIAAEGIYGLTESVLGHHDAPKYFPIIGALFVFIFSCNVIGLIPGFLPPTDNLNTTLALGTFVFIYYNWVGLKTNGIGYLKHFFGPVLWLSPLMLIIELASHVFRPLSLALRLRGNIMGDHVVLHVFSSLVPYLIPVIFYGMGLFVAFIQSFVFCLLTMVYISLSSAHEQH